MLHALASHLPVELRSGLRHAWRSLAKARLWEWGVSIVEPDGLAPFGIAYVGRLGELPIASDLFGVRSTDVDRTIHPVSVASPEQAALISEMPLPGSLRVLGIMRTMVSLAPSLEQILAGYEPELRRRIRRLSSGCSVRQITDEQEILRVHRELLVPFALSRHGDRAVIVAEEDILRIAKSGYLGLVSLGGEVVAAHVGFSYRHGDQKVFSAVRFGYPSPVFGDGKKLADANTLNAYCALQHAAETGHDVFDFGTSCARPEGGLLQFKRRRGGELSTFDCESSFWIRLPRSGSAEFLWRWPIFSVDHDRIALHLGVPPRVSDDEVLARMKKLTYGGLGAICLHTARPLGPQLLGRAGEIYGSSSGAVHGKGSAQRFEILEAA